MRVMHFADDRGAIAQLAHIFRVPHDCKQELLAAMGAGAVTEDVVGALSAFAPSRPTCRHINTSTALQEREAALRDFVHVGKHGALVVTDECNVWVFARGVACMSQPTAHVARVGCRCGVAHSHPLFLDVLECTMRGAIASFSDSSRNQRGTLLMTKLFAVSRVAVRELLSMLSPANNTLLRTNRKRLCPPSNVDSVRDSFLEETRAWFSTTIENIDGARIVTWANENEARQVAPCMLELMAQLTRRLIAECDIPLVSIIQPNAMSATVHVLVPHACSDVVMFAWTLGGISADDLKRAREYAREWGYTNDLECVRDETMGANVECIARWYIFDASAAARIENVAPLFADVRISPRYNPFHQSTQATAECVKDVSAHMVTTQLARIACGSCTGYLGRTEMI